MDFEKKAEDSKINIPGTTGIALSTVQSINYNNIAAGLRGGGFAVTDAKSGDVVGVVKDGRYSGNVGFDPIGRSRGASFNPDINQYSVSEATNEASESNNVTPSRTSSTATNMTNSTSSPSLSTASRRALISGSGGSAARRNLL